MRDLNRYHVSTTAYLAKKLKEENRTATARCWINSLILYGTNMGNSNQHQHYDVPHILVGGVNGKLKGGRHIHYERKTVTTGNLLLSILDMYGIHEDKQGDSTGRLARTSDYEIASKCFVNRLLVRFRAAGRQCCEHDFWAAGNSDVADAAMKGDKAAVRTLIQQKADVNAPQVDGATALALGRSIATTKAVDLLIKSRREREGRESRRHHAAAWRRSTASPR